MKLHLHIFKILILIVILVPTIQAQYFVRANNWTKYRKEITFQVGASQFLGDLGGLNKTGTHYSPADLEVTLTRPAISVAYRYKFAKNFNIHTSFNYLLVSGNDKLTTDIYRNNRNLNFKSNIFELATRLEFSIFSQKAGHRYGISNTMKRRAHSNAQEFIAFIGIGGFYFNPKTINGTPLRQYHTEGQGLPGGPKQYSNFSVSIPIGVAYRTMLSKIWCVGIELNFRKTFTDYIDDVSTSYYFDKPAMLAAYGPQSIAIADPSLGNIPGATSPNGDGTGAQRGDKQKDSYMGLQITVGRFLASKRTKSRLRSKF